MSTAESARALLAAKEVSPLAEGSKRYAATFSGDSGWAFTFFDDDGAVLVRISVGADGQSAEVVE